MIVTFDAKSTFPNGGTGGPTYSWTHTPVGTPTAVGVWVGIYGGGNRITGVTYGGTDMGAAVFSVLDAACCYGGGDYIFGLVNPLAGAQTVVVTTSGTGQYLIAAAVTVLGSDTTTCFRSTTNHLISSGTTISTAVTTVAGDLVVDNMETYSGGNASTPGGSQTSAWALIQQNNLASAGSYQAAVGTSTTMSWTVTPDAGGQNYDQVIGVFKLGAAAALPFNYVGYVFH